MDPKAKAQHIYDRMKGFRVTNVHRKKCARVSIQETLDAVMDCAREVKTIHYWEQVKNELEEL